MSKRTDQQARAKGTKATKRKRKKAAEIRQYGQYGKPYSRNPAETGPNQQEQRFNEMAAMMGVMPPLGTRP